MIRSLNLDSMFAPRPLPQIEFEMFKFSGGEIHIKLNNRIDYSVVTKVVITQRIKNSDDIMAIMFAKDALERKGIRNFELIIPYVPYARQDRVAVEGESFTLKVFCNIINSMKFDEVVVIDAHSDVTTALLDRSRNISNSRFVEYALKDISETNLILVSPDAGASKKTHSLFKEIPNRFTDLIQCDKIRDVRNGEITGVKVFSDDLKGSPCLIVDDICDGGRTFIEIASELKNRGAGNIYLFVTHGIFSKGYAQLSNHFKRIFTTNSIKSDFYGGFLVQTILIYL